MDASGHTLEADGRTIELGWRAAEALAILIRAEGQVVSRDELFARLWPDLSVEESNLTKVVSDLRRTLSALDSARQYVETVPGMGYRIAVPTEPIVAAPTQPPRRWRWVALGAVGAVAALVFLSFQSTPHEPAVNEEAEAAYEQGMVLLSKQSWGPRQESLVHFRQAIGLDPNHARAHAALAFALMNPKGRQASLRAARRAVELDPNCADCQATLGYTLESLEWKWEESAEHLRKALELEPSNTRTRRWYSHSLAVNGRLEEALEQAEKVVAASPYSAGAHTNKAVILYLLKRYPESIQSANDAISLEYDSTGAWEFRSRSLFLTGRHKEAMGDVFRQWKPWQNSLPPTMAKLESEGWQAGLDYFLHIPNASARIGNNPYHRAWWFTLLGRNDEAVTELEAGMELRPYNMVYTAVDPGLEPLHNEPRFQQVLQQMGFHHDGVQMQAASKHGPRTGSQVE